MNIYDVITSKNSKYQKKFAVLIDPDKTKSKNLLSLIASAAKAPVDFFFVGGSLLTDDTLDLTIRTIKDNCKIPAVLFPGNTMQINKNADANATFAYFPGRNRRVIGIMLLPPYLKASNLEIILPVIC